MPVHNPPDPDINRESLIFTKRKKKDAVGHFWTDALIFHQSVTGILIIHPPDSLSPPGVIRDLPCRFVNVTGTVPG